jgi:hypothetical protein
MIEAMKQMANYIDALGGDSKKYRQAIAEAEKQEPVAWMYGCVGRGRMYAEELDDPAGWQPLYTHPPNREWVGLTRAERSELWSNLNWSGMPEHEYGKAIEAKLRSKNT